MNKKSYILRYKTRGNSDPQGKPRVYFCCHPQDFNSFFEIISEEILKRNNCSIWYYDFSDGNDYPDDETLTADLGQMQLFVIPVTSRFLYQKNHALDVDFTFAKENHIPVLPLMQENGLEDIFSRKMGDLQFLNKNINDPTSISYEEKLDKFLSAVLVGDELAAKIRDAFDAYIFLSYRKKDRKYAQELMRLIHKNEFSRSIAIWYDEFLTPGENFNQAIEDALMKSELFSMVVTPNLVNEENYVMKTEYPLAQNSGKTILPVELVETDRTELTKQYKEIPNCIELNENFDSVLGNLWKNLAFQKKEESPQHNFFIGLAYLSGIDVEINHELALSLITSAAEKGLFEACEKLVNMYRNGEGVKRDYKMAIQWQKKYIEKLENHLAKTQQLTDAVNLGSEIGKLGDYYQEQGDLKRAKDTYKKFENFIQKWFSQEGQAYLLTCYENLGEISKKAGNLAEAKEYYKKGLNLSSEIVTKNNDSFYRKSLGRYYVLLGDLSYSEGNFAEAKNYFQKRLETDLQLLSEYKTNKETLLVVYNRLGDICMEEGNLSEAKKYYEKKFIIDQENVSENQTIYAKTSLAQTYNRLGKIYQEEGMLDKARTSFDNGLLLRKEVASEVETFESEDNVAISYTTLGDLSKLEGNLLEAEECFKKSVEIREKIESETGTLASKRSLALTYDRLGELKQIAENLPKAKEYYEKALNLRLEQNLLSDMVDIKYGLSLSYEKLGLIYEDEGNLSKAKEYYTKCFELSLDIVSASNTLQNKRHLAGTFLNLGDICVAENNFAEAKKYFEKSTHILEEIALISETLESKNDLTLCYDKLGEIHQEENNLSEAKKYFQKSLEICRELSETMKTAQSYDDYAVALYRMGLLVKDAKMIQEVYSIYYDLSEKYPDVERYTKYRDYIRNAVLGE